MSIKTILFDLDGTLLPMDQEAFVDAYTKRLAKYMAPHGYDPALLIKALWSGTGAMMRNDGRRTNETVFWEVFSGIVGRSARADLPTFERFYLTDFQQLRSVCGYTPRAANTVRWLKERGFRVILATNPLFPAIATQSRIRWAGLAPEDFDHCTTYENSTCCKPNPAYYREILKQIGCEGRTCAMIGNDAGEDMAAEALGMKTFLLTDCLINKTGAPVTNWPHGGFDALQQWLEAL